MSRSARNDLLIHRMRTAAGAKALAAVVIVAAWSAQLFASWHEAAVQHVRCAEHGELTHVSSHAHDASEGAPSSSIRSEDHDDPADAHHHCDVTFVVQGSAHAPALRTAVRFTPPATTLPPVEVPFGRPARTGLLASAPKTSPPVG